MSNINVDFETLYTAQQSVYNFIQTQRNKTNATASKIEAMGSNWKGTDYRRLTGKWTQLTNSSSVASRTEKELESFSTYLTRCYNEYDKMQVDLKNLAMNLPR